jgi:DNA repair exonuclease SbcCD ATPase subunit
MIESDAPSLPGDQGTGERLIALRKLVAEKKIELSEIEAARTLTESLVAEMTFLGSSEAQSERAVALADLARLNQERALAVDRVKTAERLEKAEQESDTFASHLATLLEHGKAVGLQEGHCPLCDAPRTVAEFDRALESARMRLADRGSKLADARATAEQARAALAKVEGSLTSVQSRIEQLDSRRNAVDASLERVQAIYSHSGFAAPPGDPKLAQTMLFA